MMTRFTNDIITVPYVITGTRITATLEDIKRNMKRIKNVEHLQCKKCIHRPISMAPYESTWKFTPRLTKVTAMTENLVQLVMKGKRVLREIEEKCEDCGVESR